MIYSAGNKEFLTIDKIMDYPIIQVMHFLDRKREDVRIEKRHQREKR